jgi:hypothetical protein
MSSFSFKGILVLAVVALLCTLNSCRILKGGKKPVRLELRYSPEAFINYGYSFNLEAYVIYSNGKEKEVTGKDGFSLQIVGATYSSGMVVIENYPRTVSENIIKITGKYVNDDANLIHAIDIPFNYKGVVTVFLGGSVGSQGIPGADGGTALLLRDGKTGEPGMPGGRGSDGHNLTVYIWKDNLEFYRIKVLDLTTNQTYYYKTNNPDYGFTFDVSGGRGGTGGTGGAGGNGKDGVSTDKKTKLPGNGGTGGAGGVGGQGGNGGNVYVFIHPNAAPIESKISAYLYGGQGGYGGDGGKGGRGGSPLEGQAAGATGSGGSGGLGGMPGNPGTVFQVLVENFDVEQ